MSEEVTNFQKTIYNKYLSIVRKSQNKPYRYRKDFSKLSEDNHMKLKKLERFFRKFDNIDMEIFFSAPFKIYQEKSHLRLDYFLKRQALKDYQLYKRQLIFDTPDSDFNLKKIIESLKFIKSFLKEKNIRLSQYLKIKSNDYLPDFVLHLKDDKISFYVLFGFEDFQDEFAKISDEDKILLFSKTYLNWLLLRNKFYMSKKAKRIIREGLKKIDSIA
jgi:hypothetical protein